jgi:hypothetical protein
MSFSVSSAVPIPFGHISCQVVYSTFTYGSTDSDSKGAANVLNVTGENNVTNWTVPGLLPMKHFWQLYAD